MRSGFRRDPARRGAGRPPASWSSGCGYARTRRKSPPFVPLRRSRRRRCAIRWRRCGRDSRSSRSRGSSSGRCGGAAARRTRSPRSWRAGRGARSRTVAAGEWLLLDFGAVVDGYCADLTRTVVVGARADESQRALYGLVQEAQRCAREGVRAGMSGREADALAREPIEARGFGAAFGHSTGHGLGLEVHEAPRLARTAPDALPEDAVVTIEPGVYVAGRGGVRIEDDVHLSADGPVLLTDGCTDLMELV